MQNLTLWLASFKGKFPEFIDIRDEHDDDVTDFVLEKYLNLAMNILPQGSIEYFSRCKLQDVVDYTVAHLCQYFDVLNSYGSPSSLLRNASSMSANGLSKGYTEIAKLRGDNFASLNDFINTTAYGRIVSVYLNQTAGSSGGFCV